MVLADAPFSGHVFGYPVNNLTDIWCAGLAILVAALLVSFRLQRGSTRILTMILITVAVLSVTYLSVRDYQRFLIQKKNPRNPVNNLK